MTEEAPTTIFEQGEQEEEELLTATEVFESAKKIQYVDIAVSWGGSNKKLRLRALTANEALDLFSSKGGKKQNEAMVYIVALCAIDKTGVRLFRDGDVERLRELDFATFTMIQSEVMKLNNLEKYAKNL